MALKKTVENQQVLRPPRVPHPLYWQNELLLYKVNNQSTFFTDVIQVAPELFEEMISTLPIITFSQDHGGR